MTVEQSRKEIDEAIQAGEYALSALQDAENHLSGARGLGIWDMLGGGLISGLLKHSQMDKAQACVNEAQDALRVFQRELQDVQMNINYGIQFDNFSKVVDIVFDNFLVDALIQSRIKDTQRNLKATKQQVEQALSTLHKMRNEL